jgi:hypothetical protein
VLAALVLRLVGVPVDEVDADYILSQTRLKQGPQAHLHDGSTPPNVMNRVLGELEARHGSVASYLLQAGTSPKQLEQIRRRFAPAAW